jgi:hypothetical protein
MPAGIGGSSLDPAFEFAPLRPNRELRPNRLLDFHSQGTLNATYTIPFELEYQELF